MSLPASIPVRPAASAAAEPAGRTARGQREVPRVVGGAIDRVVALPVGEHQRDVGLSEQHRPGVEAAIDGEGIAGGDVVALGGAPQVVGRPATLKLSLMVIGTPNSARAAVVFVVEGGGAGAGTVEVAHHDGVDAGIEAFDAGDVMVEQFETAEVAGTQHGG